MLFNSLEYLIFFPAVVILYFLLGARYRRHLLLLASYLFYMAWNPAYILLILVSTAVAYGAGLLMALTPGRRGRTALLVTSLTVSLGLLFVFKYYGLFRESTLWLSGILGFDLTFPRLNVLLPVGISFYTFQTLSYTIDVYRGATPPERDFLTFALYVSFFPQLVAGPIERSTRLLPQLHRNHGLDWDRVADGLRLMAWGYFKKVVIADRVAALVNAVYDAPRSHTGLPLIVATGFFAVQIYCDFSGYSDIAIGSARVMGIRLMRNFRRPYFARSLPEFWSRWHISLSTWFRDYLYIPLGGSKVGRLRWYANLMVTFLISGLWHGAAWNFVIWGAIHGAVMVASRGTRTMRDRVGAALGLTPNSGIRSVLGLVSTLVVTFFSWVFFRAGTVADALYVISHMFRGLPSGPRQVVVVLTGLGLSSYDFLVAVFAVVVLFFVEAVQERKGDIVGWLKDRPLPVRVLLYQGVLLVVFLFSYASVTPEFIYFQF